MKQLIGYFLIQLALTSGIVFVFFDGTLREQLKLLSAIETFLLLIFVGSYLITGGN